MIVHDYSLYGSLNFLEAEMARCHKFTEPGWYERRSENTDGKKVYDCCLLIAMPKGSDPKQYYTLYVFQGYHINEVKQDWFRATLMSIIEII